MNRAQAGIWGGEHVRLEVLEGGALVDYDCAHGTIAGDLFTDERGNFSLRGTHVRERGGPVRKGEVEEGHPATFEGRIEGDTMTLTVTESDTGEVVGTFTLAFGRRPHVVKCR
jgi:hypothetical protein